MCYVVGLYACVRACVRRSACDGPFLNIFIVEFELHVKWGLCWIVRTKLKFVRQRCGAPP
jgi:hypothetical protein